jgi:hypothetical protein
MAARLLQTWLSEHFNYQIALKEGTGSSRGKFEVCPSASVCSFLPPATVRAQQISGRLGKGGNHEKQTFRNNIIDCAAVLAQDRCRPMLNIWRTGYRCSSKLARSAACDIGRHRQSRQHGRRKTGFSRECVRSRVAIGGGIACYRVRPGELQPGRSLGGKRQSDRGRQHNSRRFLDVSSKRSLRERRCYG